MSETGSAPFAPVEIGSRAEPPFARLPDPATHFRLRAQRFAVLAQTHPLSPYLRFMAGLAEAQHQTATSDLPAPQTPGDVERERAKQHAMPPIDRNRFGEDAALAATFDRLFDLGRQVEMPGEAAEALGKVARMANAEREAMARAAFENRIDPTRLAETAFLAAGMQVHAARVAARLDARTLAAVGQGACPACGGPPVSSAIVGWIGSQSSRFAVCATCATQWHVVRVKCVACSSTEGISYLHVEGTSETIKAECCDKCGTYLKLMQNEKDPALDPVADDVGSAGLDLLVRDKGFRRSGFNVYLAGF